MSKVMQASGYKPPSKAGCPSNTLNPLAFTGAIGDQSIMNGYDFTLSGIQLCALGSGALLWPDKRLLCVSDLHLGKSERISQRGDAALPPYDTRDTLNRLAADLAITNAEIVVCLGDNFGDSGTAKILPEDEELWIARLQDGRRWVWVHGNHGPGPTALGGTHLSELPLSPLSFRHIARPGASGEVSGHYHPKVSVRTPDRSISRAAFLVDRDRVILPSYGSYTDGLASQNKALTKLMRADSMAILTGRKPRGMPMPR